MEEAENTVKHSILHGRRRVGGRGGTPLSMYLAQDVQKMFKNISFYSASWPSADMTCA